MVSSMFETAKKAVEEHGGNKAAAARALGMPRTTLRDLLEREGRETARGYQIRGPRGRKYLALPEGRSQILIGSDFHYWPGRASTAHRAFVSFAEKLKPFAIIANGDVLDFGGISQHPPIGWEQTPTVEEELYVAQARLGQIFEASPDSQFYWPLGNHDARFERRLAMVAPEFRNIHGIHLKDHFPDWEPCWTLFLTASDRDIAVITHRGRGGIHATHNNAVNSGLTTITGHLHSAKVTPFTDYNGTRYGVDTGCMADIYHEAFQGYIEDGFRNWRSAFCLLTIEDGHLFQPELIMVVEEGVVEFRGELHQV